MLISARRNWSFVNWVLVLVIVTGAVSGCSTSGVKPKKEFNFEKSWVRRTVQNEYLGARVAHVMSPVLFESLVIQGNEIDGLVAYQQKSGREKWRRSITGGVTTAAKVHQGSLYFGAGDGFFYALDARTGSTKWSFPIRSEGLGAPLIYDNVVYFVSGTNSLYALKAESGEQVWFYNRIDAASLTVRGASEPTVVGASVLVGFSDGYLVSLNKSSGSVQWERKLGETVRFRDVDAKAVVDGGLAYVSSYDGKLYCINVNSGQVVWTNDEGGFTPVTIWQDTLFYSTSTRKVLALEKSSGKQVWSLDLANTVAGQPIVHRGLLIFGEWKGKLRAVDQKSGRAVTSFSTGLGITAMPTLNESTNYVYVMSADANLFALRLNLQSRLGGWEWEN